MKTSFSHIGSFAHQVLARSKSALVSGIASRGIYLQPKSDWTLYISQEKFRGPLTLNLKEGSTRLEKIKPGTSAQIHPGEIIFPDGDITISLEDVNIWHPPGIDNEKKVKPGRLDSILTLANQNAPDNPYLPLLSKDPGPIPGVPVIGERIQNLRDALKTGGLEKIEEGAIKLLGLGPGLTPLGDDFLLGVLLTLNRWGHVISPRTLDQQENSSPRQDANITQSLNQIIRENTHLKTTLISSSLLACALEGAADERLLKVLDGLFSRHTITQGEMRDLLRWGNSSGITVLAGMAAILDS